MQTIAINFIFTLFAFSHQHSFEIKCQSSFADSSNIYYKALKVYLDSTVDSRIKLSSNLYIEAPFEIQKKLPNQIDNFELSYLNSTEILTKTKDHHSIEIIRIEPINSFNNSTFVIQIGKFHVSKLGEKLYYGRQGSMDIKFKFNCKTQQVEVVEVEMSDQ